MKNLPGLELHIRSAWKLAALALSLGLAILLASPLSVALAHGGGEGDGPIDPSTITFDQNVNAELPLDLSFKDETGASVTLGQYFHARPVILIFAYYDCPMLCDLALSDLAQTLKGVKGTPGDQFEVLTISFNPTETPDLAADKKATALQIYGRPQAAQGWHFLTGEQPEIEQLTKTAGFHYQYDPSIQEYAHPTGVIVLTPEGKIERYIMGIDYKPTDLRLALLDATDRKTASPVDQVFFLCYHYDPVTGQYNLAINQILRLAGMGTVVLLVGLVGFLNLRSDEGSFWQRIKAWRSPRDAGGQSQDEA